MCFFLVLGIENDDCDFRLEGVAVGGDLYISFGILGSVDSPGAGSREAAEVPHDPESLGRLHIVGVALSLRPEGSVAAAGFAAGINPPEMPGVHVRNSQGVMDYTCNAESTSHAHVFLVTSKIIDFGFPEFLAGFVDFGISRRVSAVFVRPKNIGVFQGGGIVEEGFFVIGESVPVDGFGLMPVVSRVGPR